VPRTPKRFTYDELVSAGRFGQVGNARLRDQIAHYYVRLDTVGMTMLFVPPYREHIRSLMPNAAQQAVRSQCAETFHYISDGQPLSHLPENCTIELDPAAVANAVAAVRASR
jgi:cyclopropane fatty-acyl-phospholipid synthase-like methyltransferase